ncbi:MAG: PilZ domain-containing protein, partial [Miltoncostaeaceae bacterium]
TRPRTRSRSAGAMCERGMTLYIEDPVAGPWLSVVEDREGDLVVLAAPRRSGGGISAGAGRAVVLAYAVRQVPCEVDAEWVEGAHIRAGAQVVVLRMTGPPRRLQRRSAVRVPVELVVRARPEPGEAPEADAPGVAAVTENLSAGGALMRMPQAVETGVEVLVTLHTPGEAGGPMEILSRVVRCDRERSGGRPWRVALAFQRLSSDEEERIVRFLFRTQRERRARETGMA